jgi:predicted MFS family arabinose efflux permease
MSTTSRRSATAWFLVAASTILLITMGIRQTSGLFLLPITESAGVSIVALSFALAVGQFVFGAAQPVFGAIADKYGAVKVIVLGAILLVVGSVSAPLMPTNWGLLVTLGILSAAGAAAGSFSILFGITAQRLPPERRSFAAGLINAGGSLGQFVLAPLIQWIIAAYGWVMALFATAFAAALTIPLAWPLRQPVRMSAPASAAAAPQLALGAQLSVALRDRSYLCLHAGFFTCGFHIAFLVTHLPSDIKLCGLTPSVAANSLALIGLFNVVGSIGAGWLGQHYRMKYLLAAIYASRALIVALYLAMPKTALNVYLFAAALGVTWLATVPPTSGLVGKLFGTRYLATLFGLTLLSHQVGGFLGAWLGGLVLAQQGSYVWIWYADMALALLAAAANLPIKEARVMRAGVATA